VRRFQVAACVGVFALTVAAGPVLAGQGGTPDNHASGAASLTNAHGGNTSANDAATSNDHSQGNVDDRGNDGTPSTPEVE